jgi:exoribonuclease II
LILSVQLPREGSLVLYKGRPARVQRMGEKLELQLADGEGAKVRLKDVDLLHPGPLGGLGELHPMTGEVAAAWELLAGGSTTLHELAELAFGGYTPATAWAAWQLVADGLYFRGTPDAIQAATPEEVEARQAARASDVAERQAWEGFLERVRAGQFLPEDGRYLHEVEALALGRSNRSRVLQVLAREETPESAHALLLKLGYWTPFVDPYPARQEANMSLPAEAWPALPDEARRDLTHLPAFAIDDAATETPDDALSLEGERLWIHIADPAAVVPPDSLLDREARARGVSLYLPECTVPMLPMAATEALGLGLQDLSPALSLGLDLDADGRMANLEIVPSWLHVTRLTYESSDAALEQEPLAGLYRLALANQARRRAAGAVMLELPEVDIKVRDGAVQIYPVPPLRSRTVVEEAMILAGEAVARFGMQHGIALPYAAQETPDVRTQADTLSEMYALRRSMKPRRYQSTPGPHAGLGLGAYVQVTSPMRRYLDLVAHQQLRAYAQGGTLLGPGDIIERIGEVEAVGGALRQTERLADQHWVLVYLLAHPDWHGDGILVEKRGLSAVILIPELAWEARVHLPADLPLDSAVHLTLGSVDLPRLDARFRVER